MSSNSLTQFYDELKGELNQKPVNTDIQVGHAGNLPISPGAQQWRGLAGREADRLSDHAAKTILLRIYCQLLPVDADYIQGNQGVMKQDVDSFLAAKGQTATQYLTSCKEAGKQPLLEYILRACQGVGRSFMEKANETLKDAQEKNLALPPPVADEQSEEVEGQIVEIEKDNEFEEFIRKMREKTVKKIIDDVSELIDSKKKDKDMNFDLKKNDGAPVGESTVATAIDYIHQRLWKENVTMTPEQDEAMMGLAMREAVINEIDRAFGSKEAGFLEFSTRIRFGKGYLIKEAAFAPFMEAAPGAATPRFEPLYKEVDGKKFDISNMEKVDAGGRAVPMTDAEAQTHLSKEGYEEYKKKGK